MSIFLGEGFYFGIVYLSYAQYSNLSFHQILPAITMNTQDTLFTNMMKRLNLSSDEPVRSERAAPSAPSAQPVNVNVPLPGQTTIDSEDEVGNENHGFGDDSVSHTVLNNILKSADIKRKEENYSRTAATLENGSLSSAQVHTSGKCVCVDTGVQVTCASVGVQSSLPDVSVHPVMLDKSVQVAIPILLGTDSQMYQSNSSGEDNNISVLNCRDQENMKKVNETTFCGRRTRNTDRPGTPVSKIISRKNHKNEKVPGHHRLNNSNHGINKHFNKASSRGKSKRNRGETDEVMTVLDIADESP